MANEGTTIVLGIPIPSTDAVFLAIIGVHVLFGLAAVITGALAMLSKKGRGRHSNFGTIYFLVPIRRDRHHERLVVHALGRELSFVHSGGAFIRVGVLRAHCGSLALAPMAKVASHQHGCLVYFYANCV